MADTFQSLRVSRDGPVVGIQLSRPETGNAISDAVIDELLDVLRAVHDQADIRVVVLSAAGGDFCAGGDRLEYQRMIAADPTGVSISVLGGKARRLCEALASSPAVTIARLHGQVIGAGLALAVHCDLRAGADSCRFRLPELAFGLPAVWGGALPRLLHEVGAARIRELVLTGDGFDAAAARQLSVLHTVVPEAELDGAVERWIRPLVRRPAAALRATKAALHSYSAAARLADATLLDGELLAAVLAAGQPPRGGA